MRFISGYGFGGIWDDTKAWTLQHLPTWLTGVTPVDVSPGEAGIQELIDLLPTLQGKILLSARAQLAYWAILDRQAAWLDQLFAETASIGGPTGQRLRTQLEQQRQELIAHAVELQRLNTGAIAEGVPEALEADWYPDPSTRVVGPAVAGVLTSPALWEVVGVVVIASIVLASAATVVWGVSKYFDLQETIVSLQSLPNADARLQYLDRKWSAKAGSAGGFPWGWVLGLGGIALGGVLLVAWGEGTITRWTNKLRSGGSSPQKSWY